MESGMGNEQRPLDIVSQRITDTIGRLFDIARPGAVFSEPVEAEGYIAITAKEIVTGMGMGLGAGSGEEPAGEDGKPGSGGEGAGGGGGGYSYGRPVAVISIGQDGVQVTPVLDATKIGLALLTAWGAIAITTMRMRRFSRRSLG